MTDHDLVTKVSNIYKTLKQVFNFYLARKLDEYFCTHILLEKIIIKSEDGYIFDLFCYLLFLYLLLLFRPPQNLLVTSGPLAFDYIEYTYDYSGYWLFLILAPIAIITNVNNRIKVGIIM